MNAPVHDLESRLAEALRALDSAVIALSGGVDSSVVAAIARRELGERALAVTGVSPSLSAVELDEITSFCADIGIAHRTVHTHEMEKPGYVRNQPDRCFHCKDELYGKLRALADREGFTAVLDGTHADDLKGHRPSLKAAESHRVASPFVELGFGKETVRALARGLGLSNAERPATPCLSSRVAYGLAVTPGRLSQVETAENALKALGFERLRVRHHDAIARIEVPTQGFADVIAQREAILDAVKAAGFTYVTLDLGGLRSGSLLEVINHHPIGIDEGNS